jgi:hypothetical protein
VFWDKPRANALWHALRVDGPLPGTAPKPKPSSSASPTASLTVPPSAIHVRVLNGTGKPGLAHQVAQDLAARGFVIDGVGDADSTGYTSTVVRYDTDRNDSARTLAASVKSTPSLQLDGALSSTLELIVGSDYTGVQAVQVATPSATPTPTASLDVVTASRAVCTT